MFDAVTSTFDFLQLVFGLFKQRAITPESIRHILQVELQNKERLLGIYSLMIAKLGGVGRKGDDVLSFIVRFLNNMLYFRTSKLLSRSSKDIRLVSLLYSIGTDGRHVDAARISNTIKELKKRWHANYIEARTIELEKMLSSAWDMRVDKDILAVFLATAYKR